MASCVLYPRQGDEVELGNASAYNVLVPGIENVQPLSVAITPDYTGNVSVHVSGNATNYDTVQHTLSVMVGRDTVLPNSDATKFVVVPAASSVDFDLEVDYNQLGTGFQFNEVVSFGSDATNKIVVNRVGMVVDETL